MDAVNRLRRSLIEAGVWTFAAAELGMPRNAAAQPAVAGEPVAQSVSGTLKQIEAGTLASGTSTPAPFKGQSRSCFTAGHTTSTAMPMLCRCWRPRATAS